VTPAAFELLREFGLAYVVADEPHLPAQLEITAPFAYVRWHGHGAPLWYDYTYTPSQLEAWAPQVRTLAEHVPVVYGFFNNHFRGDAAVNARTLSELLGLPLPPGRARLD
jgi:uncharacterized protein YecE (DUF72 family)